MQHNKVFNSNSSLNDEVKACCIRHWDNNNGSIKQYAHGNRELLKYLDFVVLDLLIV